MYVLMTKEETYFVEYLFGSLLISAHICEAMIFNDIKIAKKFQEILLDQCDLITSINTFIK